MIWYLIPIAAVILSFVCLNDRTTLRRAYAKPLAHVLNVLRWSTGIVCLAAVPFLSRQMYVAAGFAIIAGVLLLVPYRWLLAASGGREPKWELRDLMGKAALLRNKALRDYPTQQRQIDRMRGLMRRIEGTRTEETSELCDLELANCRDWMSGSYSLLLRGWRSIRMHEIEQGLYGDLARRAELDRAEATFRWRLYRTFAWLIDAGDPDMSPDLRLRFEGLLDELHEFKRPDTERFIELVEESATSWLSSDPKSGPWLPAAGLVALGPVINDEYSRLWPATTVFFGAQLDERDMVHLSGADVLAPAT